MIIAAARLLDRFPHPFRHCRHFDMAHAKLGQRIHDRIDDNRERRHRAAFASWPDAERMR